MRTTSEAFVGRARELATLRAALERASSGTAGTVPVSGAAGVGESRPVGELTGSATDAGARALIGRCVDLGEGELPYAPIAGALRSLAAQVPEPELADHVAATHAGRWCDVFEIRDFEIQRCFIYLDPDYAGTEGEGCTWLGDR